ncbi:MAG: MmgE/PrpD family protein [Dehalococcoidia bacterium]
MNGPDLEERIVEHLSKTGWDDLPEAAIEAARRCIVDTFGVIVAGSSGDDIERLVGWLERQGGPPTASVLVYGTRLPAAGAAWANAAMTRAREFDDSHDPTGDHTSTPIFAAALAVAHLVGQVSGRDFLTAYVLAADLVSRLRLAPRKKVGGTGFAANTYAPFAAAIAAGWLLGLRGRVLYDALGWAYAQAAGAVQLQQSGNSALHIHHGLAAATGVQAALMAREGFPGMQGFLTGTFGLYNAYEGGEYDASAVTAALGDRFEIEHVAVKQYPSGRVTHGPIDAALALKRDGNLDAERVESVHVAYTAGGFNMTCEPEAQRRIAVNPQHAKFSLYYTVACALARGHVGLEDFTPEAVADPRVAELAAKVHVTVDPELKMILPPGILTVRLRGGRELHSRVDHLKGSPENPVNFEDCANKLRACLAFSARPLHRERVEAAIASIAHLGATQDVGALATAFTTE